MGARIIFVTGVSGAGKTTLAQALARALDAQFLEGDEFHPMANRAAMAAGQPLTDAMRAPWLDAIGLAAVGAAAEGRRVVVSCSALKRSYRDRLRAAADPCRFLFLDVPQDTLAVRLGQRSGHFFPPALLDSQLATLERPAPDEADVTVLRGTLDRETLVRQARIAVEG